MQPNRSLAMHVPCTQCFAHFHLYLKGREELVVTVFSGGAEFAPSPRGPSTFRAIQGSVHAMQLMGCSACAPAAVGGACCMAQRRAGGTSGLAVFMHQETTQDCVEGGEGKPRTGAGMCWRHAVQASPQGLCCHLSCQPSACPCCACCV